ncbi:MAG: VOC family protein [Pseudomonadota bacterium]
MQVQRTGIILNTHHYDACVAFYRDLFELPILYEKSDADFRLTCFEFGGSYLMIETEGVAREGGKTIAENPTKLRFNVADIEAAQARVKEYGIDAQIERYPWGDTINVSDPDGNRVGIRDEASF